MRWLLALVLLLIASHAWAAPSCTLLTSDVDTVDRTSYTTASVTLTANRLILLKVLSKVSSGTSNAPSATSTGATWETVDDQIASTRRVSVLRTMVGSNQTGVITIDFGGQTQQTSLWAVEECDSVDTTGSNGENAIVTSSSSTGASSSETYTVTFPAFSSSSNRPNVTMATNAISAGTSEAGWTELASEADAAVGGTLVTAWRNDTTDTTYLYTRISSWTGLAVTVEIKDAPAATPTTSGFLGGGFGPFID
jgi:hypothetical protein